MNVVVRACAVLALLLVPVCVEGQGRSGKIAALVSTGSILHQATVTLADADIRNLPVSTLNAPYGHVIIPAAGPDRVLIFVSGSMYAQFAGGGYGNLPNDFDGLIALESEGAVNVSNIIRSNTFSSPQNSVVSLSPRSDVVLVSDGGASILFEPFTGVADKVNTAIVLSLWNADMTPLTGGDPANTLRVTVAYLVLNLATGLYE